MPEKGEILKKESPPRMILATGLAAATTNPDPAPMVDMSCSSLSLPKIVFSLNAHGHYNASVYGSQLLLGQTPGITYNKSFSVG